MKIFEVAGLVNEIDLRRILKGLKEFALPGSGDGDSGRWYTDDELADIIGDDWFQDFDVSHDEFNIDAYGEKAKKNLAGYANSWFDDKGYNVNVMGVDHNDVDHDLKWYIVGSFQNDNFADKDIEEGQLAEDANFMPAGDYQGYPIEVRKTKFNDKYFIAQTTRPIGKDPLKAAGATQDEALQNLKDKIDGEIAKKQVHKKNITTVGFGAPFAQGVLRKGNQKFYVKFADGKVLVSDTPEQGFRPVTKNSPQAISPSGSFKVDEIKAAGFDISTRYELVPTGNENEFEAKKHSLITGTNNKYVMPFPGMAIHHPDRSGVEEGSGPV